MQYPSLNPPSWLATRLAAHTDSPPRYESSWYGPHNGLLGHYFPTTRQFPAKPQPKIRPPYDASPDEGQSNVDYDDEAISTEGDVSFDSDGGIVMPRHMGRERLFIPDFVVAKASESVKMDRTLAIVEVKVDNGGSLFTDSAQINDYMEGFADNHSEFTDLLGLLIRGAEVIVFRKASVAAGVVREGAVHDINSAYIRQLLRTTAIANWALPGPNGGA